MAEIADPRVIDISMRTRLGLVLRQINDLRRRRLEPGRAQRMYWTKARVP